jgi:hypothetical protein
VPVQNLFYSGTRKSEPKYDKSKTVSVKNNYDENTNETETGENNEDYEDDIWDEYPQYESESDANTSYASSKTSVKKDNPTDLSDLPPNIYCDLVTTIDKACFELSLLEIWLYDEETVAKLTQQQILDKINTLEKRSILRIFDYFLRLVPSPWFFSPRNYSSDLGGVTHNSTGHIVSAEVAWVQIVIQIPEDAELVAPGGIGLEFEVSFIKVVFNILDSPLLFVLCPFNA